MKTGWVAKAENASTTERVQTLYACSKKKAVSQFPVPDDPLVKVELVGPYTEIDVSNREQKEFSGELENVMKELADLNPVLVKSTSDRHLIDVDKT